MPELKVSNMENLERLETKVEEAVRKLTWYKARCESLERDNRLLQEDMETLQERNTGMSKEMEERQALDAANNGGDKEDIIRRIDKMLEKFGELQI